MPADSKNKSLIVYPGGSKAFILDAKTLDRADASTNIRAVMKDEKIVKAGMHLKQVIKFLEKNANAA